MLRDKAGCFGPLWRNEQLSGTRQRTANQNGARRQARRGRAAARPEGLSLDREDPALHRRRRIDFPAAAPRHLFHRRPGGADLRPEKRQPAGARQREAGLGSGRRHDCRRRVAKGLSDLILISGFDGGTGASPRSSIKHAGLPVGAWAFGNPSNTDDEQAAQPCRDSRPTVSS